MSDLSVDDVKLADPPPLQEAGARDEPGSTLAGIQLELIGARFLLLARLLRRTARADYAPYEPHNLTERRLVLTLLRIEEGRVSELAGLLGNDVAQVSRALGNMRSAGLVGRERQRDPYRLTDAGMRLAAVLDEHAMRREEELAQGLDRLQMFELAGFISNLLAKAAAILADEIAHAKDGGEERIEQAEAIVVPEIHGRLQPAILNLATIIARSAGIAFKRLAGLSNYEWRLLANIAARPGIPFMQLVGLIDSDKAQASRALDAMVARGVLDRTSGRGRQAVRFTLTDEGNRLHSIMQADALRRNEIILEDLKTGQRSRLLGYLEQLVANAARMTERG